MLNITNLLKNLINTNIKYVTKLSYLGQHGKSVISDCNGNCLARKQALNHLVKLASSVRLQTEWSCI